MTLLWVGLAFAAGLVAGLVVGIWYATDDERGAALGAGVGRYEVDPKTGKKRFVYGVFH